jgi:hypothetical protein
MTPRTGNDVTSRFLDHVLSVLDKFFASIPKILIIPRWVINTFGISSTVHMLNTFFSAVNKRRFSVFGR